MGLKLSRKKPKSFLLTFIYRLQKLIPISSKVKMKLFLDLEWIFDRLAFEHSFSSYTIENHPIRKFSIDFIVNNIEASDCVLDLGCKYGELAALIAQKAKKTVGIDHDKVAIEKAKKNYESENLTFFYADALNYLETSNEKFDLLILSHILEHLDEPKSFLMSLKGYFSKIYIEVPDFDKTYLNQFRLTSSNTLNYSDDDHISEFDREELKELLEQCGLQILKEEYRFGVMKVWCK
jgi:SAM-dependent methyltransferase